MQQNMMKECACWHRSNKQSINIHFQSSKFSLKLQINLKVKFKYCEKMKQIWVGPLSASLGLSLISELALSTPFLKTFQDKASSKLSTKGAKMAGDEVCLPKEEDALGVKHIKEWNKPAMFKHLCHLCSETNNSIWSSKCWLKSHSAVNKQQSC